jgi:hypothetical protein
MWLNRKILSRAEDEFVKKVLFAFHLVYRWYEIGGQTYYKNTGRTPTGAYFSTILAYLALIYLNLYTLGIIFHLPYLLTNRQESPLVVSVKIGALYFLPGYFLASRIIKEADVKNLDYDEKTLKRGYIILFTYVASTFLVFFLV